MSGEGRVSILDGNVIWCKSENHVPLVAVSKGLRTRDFPWKALGDRLQIPGVQAPESGRTRFQNGWNNLKEASVVNLPTDTMSWWNHMYLSQEETTLDDMSVLPSRVNRSSFHRGGPRAQLQASQLAGTIFRHV